MANRFCPNCGTEVPENSAFCVECGEPLAGRTPGSPTPASPKTEATTADSAPKPKRTGLIVAIACLVGALVVGAVIAIVVVSLNGRPSSTGAASSQGVVERPKDKDKDKDADEAQKPEGTSTQAPDEKPQEGTSTQAPDEKPQEGTENTTPDEGTDAGNDAGTEAGTEADASEFEDLLISARAHLADNFYPRYVEEQAINRAVINNENVTVLILGTGVDEVDGKDYPCFSYAILSKKPQSINVTIAGEQQGDTRLTDEEAFLRTYDDENLIEAMVWYDEEDRIGTYTGGSCTISLKDADSGADLGSAEVVFE